MQESERPSSTLKLRMPSWTYSSGAKATLNGQDLSLPTPGTNRKSFYKKLFIAQLFSLSLETNREAIIFSVFNAGNFMSVTKSWNPGDTITLDLPLSLRMEAIKGVFLNAHEY